MARFFVVLVAILASSSARLQKLSLIALDSHHQSTSFEGKKQSTGAELTALAHSSAQQARTAVRNQQSASLQATLGTQSGYASAASEAASATQVALIGKQVIVQNLQAQVEDAERQLLAERSQYQQTLQAARAAQTASQQSQQQMSTATAALAAVQQSTTQTERAATAAAQAAATQHEMIQQAQQRLGRLQERLNEALAGLGATQAAAQRAQNAAKQAQSNAEGSAALAVLNSASQQNEEHDSGFHH